jgi:sugar diacid utilization regulator
MTAVGQPSAGDRVARLEGVSRENRVLRELVAIYHHLTGLALQSADLDSVIRLLARRTAAMVAVVSPTLDVLAAAAADPAAPAAARAGDHIANRRLGRVLGTVTQTRRALRLPAEDGRPSLVVAPILVGDEVVAYLLAEEAASAAAGEDLSLLVTEHAATICGVILGRERIVGAAAGRVRDDLVEGLLLGRASSPEELQRWAQHLGYDAARAHRVLCLVVEQVAGPDAEEAAARRSRIFRSVEHFVGGRAPAAIVAARERELVILAREPAGAGAPPGAGPLGAAALSHVRRTFPAAVLTAGLSGTCQEPVEIARAYAQARRTIETARRLGRRGQVVAFEDLGIHRLLLEVPDLGELRAFAEEVLGPLAAHERKHRSGYLRTLAIYFRENGSLQRAARELQVHPNTVTYRLNRVEALTGLELGRYQDRLMAQVALEIMEALDG